MLTGAINLFLFCMCEGCGDYCAEADPIIVLECGAQPRELVPSGLWEWRYCEVPHAGSSRGPARKGRDTGHNQGTQGGNYHLAPTPARQSLFLSAQDLGGPSGQLTRRPGPGGGVPVCEHGHCFWLRGLEPHGDPVRLSFDICGMGSRPA